ncbi:uncharacterized protein B0H18DRAFT_516086 [Fomitopsis serialis]|uniref:uncharacterized protein n=1 Tax=Fomitopsis serialis TaxID=139415 RepID=UPI002008784C|nr:uncharacterized protein B0H18DRAFT_516086 [Neoantrodia serialis]KAH9910160.1 hypothetical protein B0H18DRAFT_516086 [Neoantrodia serialis]
MRDRRVQTLSTKPSVRLDLSLYDASLLRDEIAVGVAISDLEGNLVDTDSVNSIVEDLASVPHLLEFALSVVDDEAARKLSECILASFPADAKSFATSLAGRLIERFSLFLVFLRYPSPSAEPEDIRDTRHSVERAKRVLEVLAGLPLGYATAEDPGLAGRSSSGLVKQKGKGKKQPRTPSSSVKVDLKLLNELDIKIPSDRDEALAVVASIMFSQKRILQNYMQIIRYPHLTDTIKGTYITRDVSASTASQRVEGSTGTEETASAYPFVQPLKAALYFDSAKGFGEWTVLISTSAHADLRQMRKKSLDLFNITVKKIRELSNGHFSPDNHKQLTVNADIPIFEAKMTGDSRLVYQIDCVPEFETNVKRQAIRIFGIYTHAQIDRRHWDTLGNQLGRQGKEYQARCIFRNRPTQVRGHARTILPASWPAQVEVEAAASQSSLPDLHKDDLKKVHEMLVLQKYVSFSQALLNSILADQEATHVFQVSSQEMEIIEHTRSCYVLGRSGTGKTTTMLYKMLGIEHSWRSCDGALGRPRQLFVTQSRVLAEKVQEHFMSLHSSLLTANKSADELRAMASIRQTQQDQGLVDLDEEMDFRGDLPRRYSELTEEHFPMFVTFDQLCRLLEADFPHSSSLQPGSLLQDADRTTADTVAEILSNDYMQQQRKSFVSYGEFLKSYWAHFPQPLTKGLDPALVFAEIMGVIKGSEQSWECEDGYLDRVSYYNLSRRTQATFGNQREVIYDLFHAYLKHKRRRGEYDAADRTRRLLKALESYGLPGKHVDFLYIDEAQDNMLIDALLLRSLSHNADSGLFWAGDTAQTISMGSAFRFNDLKAFLHRVELSGGHLRSASGTQPEPRTFNLAVNYRSHAGIVNCAHSIVELITEFWPNAIDRLAPERGTVDGEKPVFLSGWDEDTVRYEQFLFGDSGGHIEFGAEQCILVRDDAARKRLRAQVGDIGLILTLYESKGLEFNDVLLYNFFADSTVEHSQWRVILNALSNSDKAVATVKAPDFDEKRHNGVCRDLKFLYVAITRARNHLWIADNSIKCEPMRHFWTANGHIQNHTPSDSDIPRLATTSTSEEWAKTAFALFSNRRYSQAMHCYERAKLVRECAVAEAYYLEEKARAAHANTRAGNSARVLAFTKAADAFWRSGLDAVKEKQTYFRKSAECYIQGNDLARAARAYILAEKYTLAAQLYRKAGLFDDAVAVIKSHSDSIEPEVLRIITDVSRLEYLRKRNMKQARSLFDSDEDALNYMDKRGLDIARAMLLEQLGRLTDAAQVHLDEGRMADAIPLLLQDRGNPEAARRAAFSLLEGLRCRLSFGVIPGSEIAQSDTVLQELRRILNSQGVNIVDVDDTVRDELLMFKAIISNDVSKLLKLSEQFRQRHNDMASALRCLDNAFIAMPNLRGAPLPFIADTLRHFSVYVNLLHAFASTPNLSDNEGIQRLFAFKAASEDFFLIPDNTFLYAGCVRRWSQGFRGSDQGVLILKHELNRLLRHSLQERLCGKVREENELCHRTRAFQVCLPFFAFGRCNRECLQEHVVANEYTMDQYNLRIRVILQQILIYNSAHAVEDRFVQARQHRFWLRQLHEALNPPFFKLGTVCSLRPLMIPEYKAAMQAVRKWVLDWLYDLWPHGSRDDLLPTFLTALMRTISLGLTVDSGALHNHLPQVRSVVTCRPKPLLRGQDGTASEVYIVQDLDRFVFNVHPASLASGILYVNHILVKRLSIDIVVLCEFMDNLASLLIVASQLNDANTLHDLTMPRSWLQRVLPSLHQLQNKSTDHICLYIEPVAALLEQIYTSVNAGYLLFESSDLSKLGWHVRNVFLARICRNLCLVGYNSRYRWLRDKVHSTITSLYRPDREFNSVYRHYVCAEDWAALAKEVRGYSTTRSPFDEMVQLYHARRGQSRLPPRRNVRRIIYNDVSEIPALLASGANTTSQPRIGLSGNAVTFVPQQTHMSSELQVDDSPAIVEVEEDEYEVDEAGNEEDVDAVPPVVNLNDESLAFGAPDPVAAQLAQEKLDAARVLAHVYLRTRRRKKVTFATPAAAIHFRFANAYRAMYTYNWVESLETPQKRYRLLLLVPLPYGMAFLELARNYLNETETRLQKSLATIEHWKLEKVSIEMEQCEKRLEETIRLIEALEPSASMHEKRDGEELRARIREVEQLAGSLPPSVTAEWNFYLKTAVDGILKQKPRPTKKPKPELNMADDDMVDYADAWYDEYNDAGEIPAALLVSGADTAPFPTLGLHGDAAPFAAQRADGPSRAVDSLAAAVDLVEDEHHDNLPEANGRQGSDTTPPVVNLDDQSLAFPAPDPADAQLAQEKLDAARVLADAYLRARLRKKNAFTTPATAIHLRFANAYRATYTYKWVESMEKPQRLYRLLLLVPLPYSMVFLELARNHLRDTKNRLRRLLVNVDYSGLEKVSGDITQCNDQLKEAIRLIKALQPGASMHERRDGEELRACMREVEQLARSLPSNVTAGWDFYLKTAVDGILKQKPQPMKKPKPELNMADENMVDHADIAWSDDE